MDSELSKQYDEKAEKARALLAKQRALQNHELWREQQELLNEAAGSEKKEEKQGDTFVSRLTETILNNLQVEISNVHIRYEDGSNPKNRIVFGLTMEKLSLKSCNDSWEEVFIKTAQQAFYKKLLLQNLSFYMNNNEVELFSKSGMDTKKFSLHMRKIITENKFYRRFIVSPINGELKLILQKEGQIDMSKPKLIANLFLDNVNLCLDDRQYKNLLSTLEYMTNYAKFEKFRHLRPKSDYVSSEKQLWWEYLVHAAKDIVEKQHFTWEQVEERKKDRKEHIELFKRTKEYPWQKKLSDSEKKSLQELEDKLDFDDILFFRELAHEELKVEKEKNKHMLVKKEKSGGWFSGWFGGGTKTASTTSTEEEPASPVVFEFTDEQREELHKTIGYNAKEKSQSLELPADYVAYQINFFLKQGELKLRSARVKSSDSESAIVKGAFNNFRTEVGVRAQGSVIVRVTLEDFEITDHFSDVTQFKKIVSKRKESGQLAEVLVETKPLDGESDLKLQVLLQQVDIAINIPLIQKILSFFIIPSNLDFSTLQSLAMKQFENLQQQALTQLKVALESKMIIDLNVLILAPTFIVPLDHKDENSKVVLLDLGKLKFKSDIDKIERARRIKNETVEEKDFYDRFDIELSNIQAMITDVSSFKNNTYVSESSNSFQLVEKVNVGLKLGLLITNDPNYAGTKLEGTIPNIKINLSPMAMNTIIKITNNFLVLADNPTGNSKEDVELKGAMKVKSDLLTDNQWKNYWAELTENGRLMLYTNENDLKAAGCIILNERSVEYQERDKNSELNALQWCAVIPQDTGPTTVYFEVENQNVYDKWFNLMITKNVNRKLVLDITNTENAENEEVRQKKVNFKLTFNLGEFCASLVYNKKMDNTENSPIIDLPLTDIKLQDFSVDMAVRNFDMIMNFSLRAFTISDKTTRLTDKYIITSDLQSDKRLADLTLIQVNNRESEYYGRNADLLLDVTFHKILFNFDPVSLTTFLLYIYDVIELTQQIESRVPTITPAEAKKYVEKRDKKRNTLDLHASLSEVSLVLVLQDFSNFATATIANADVSFAMNEAALYVKGTVGNLLAVDNTNDGSIYKEIVGLSSSSDKSLITFSYHQNNERPANLDPSQPYYNKFLKLVLESVKIVYLNRIIVRLQHYMQNGPLWDVLAAGGKKVSEISKDSVVKQYESLEMFNMHITLLNPLVIAPMAFNNPECIVGNLGKIRVSNSLFERNSCWLESYDISFTKMNLHTITAQDPMTYVVGDMDWILAVERPVINTENKFPGVSVDIKVSDVAMTLTQEQYQMIFKVIDGNVNDNAGFPSIQDKNDKKDTSSTIITTPSKKEITEQDAKITDVTVKVLFSNLNLTVSKSTEDSLARMNMYDLNVDFNMKRSGLSNTSVSISSADAHDLRKSDGHFKTFVDTRQDQTSLTKSQHFLLVDVINDPEKSLVKVDVKMGNPRIIFIPEIVFDIQNFFMNMRPQKPPKGKILSFENMPVGDIHINTDITLGADLSLTPTKRLIVHTIEGGNIEINGNGHTIELPFVQQVFKIEEGMTLTLTNVVIKKEPEHKLEDYCELSEKSIIVFGNGSKFISNKEGAINEDKSSTIVSVFVDNPNVMFPVKPNDPNSRLLVVRSQLKFKMQTSATKQLFVVGINELSMFVDSFQSSSQSMAKNNILEPLSLDLEYFSEHKSRTDILSDIKAKIDGNIRARVSYQDVKMITEVVNHFTEAMKKPKSTDSSYLLSDDHLTNHLSDNSETSDEEEEFEEAKDEIEHMDGQFVLSDYVESRDTISKPAPLENISHDPISNAFSFSFDMSSDQTLSILMVDDVRGYDIPLITFVLKKVHLIDTKMTQLGEKTSIKAKIIGYIQADYYNLKIASWEPIIEPYGIEFFFRRKPTSKSTTATIDRFEIRDLDIPKYKQLYHLEEFDGLLLNVTQSMINTVSSTAKLWKEEFYTETKVSKKFDPYCIRNHTGHVIKLIFPYNTQLQKADVYEIGTGQEVNFSLPEDKARGSLHAITVDVPGFNKLQLELKQTGKQHIKNTRNEVCMVDNDLIEGRKIITISSGVQIRNMCNISWEIGSLNIGNKSITRFGVIAPKEYIGIPITSIPEDILCIRPVLRSTQKEEESSQQGGTSTTPNYNYQWSVPSGGLKFTELLKLYKGSKNVTIPNTSGPNMFAIVRTNFALETDYQEFRQKYAEVPLLFQRFYCTLDIKPPLCIDNTLGKSIDYTLISQTQNNTRTVVQEGTMSKGERIFIYSAEMNNNILLKVKMGKEWIAKELALIHLVKRESSNSSSGMPPQHSTHITLENATNNISRIYIDYSEGNALAYREIVLFSPYWIVNHTGEIVAVKTSRDRYLVTPGENLMYSEAYDREKIAVMVDNSGASTNFSLTNVGTSGNFAVSSDTKKYSIGYFISLGEGKFYRTKVLTLSPRYVIVNSTDEKILIRQCFTNNDHLVVPLEVEPNTNVNYYWKELEVNEPQISVKVASNDKISWSAPFKTNALGETFLKLKHEDYPNRPIGLLLAVDVQETQGTVFLMIQKPKKPPYLIDNQLDEEVFFSQKGVDKWWTVKPLQMTPYVWDDNKGAHGLQLRIGNVIIKDDIDIDRIGKDKRIKLGSKGVAYLRVKPVGPTRVLMLTKEKLQSVNKLITQSFKLKRKRRSTKGENIKPLIKHVSSVGSSMHGASGSASEGQLSDFTEEEEEEEFNQFMLAEINQIGISFIDNSPSEVAYLLLGGLTLRYATTDKHQFIEALLYRLQLDHQDYNATYPVILCNINEPGQEFLHFSMCRSIENNTNVNTFPYMSITMREARCEIDYIFISKFVKLIGILSTNEEQSNEIDGQTAERMAKPVEIPKSEADAEKFYFENLELHPVRIYLTFKLNHEGDDSNPLLILFKSLGVTFTRIDNAPMKFNSLILSHPFMTLNALMDKIKKHYIRQATVQFYKILGSLDIIGNPIGLFSDIGTGVVDFFYEPASAITKSPEEFASGLAKGSMSLLKNSVHGIGNFTSKLTGNVGNGIAFLTFDKEYNQQRERQASQKPKDIKEGLASGAKSLFRGIYGGATGIVTQPIRGIQEEGAIGFVKGVGKGIIGIPLKPVGGIIDMATRTVEGISNSSTTIFSRVRYPRVLAENGSVVRYSLTDAYSKYLTVTIDDGQYAKTNKPVYYMPDSTKQFVYLITDKYIMKVDHADKKVKWKMALSKIKSVELVNEPHDALKIVSTEKEKSVFGSGSNIVRLLDSLDKEYLHKFKNKLNIEIARVFKEQSEYENIDY